MTKELTAHVVHIAVDVPGCGGAYCSNCNKPIYERLRKTFKQTAYDLECAIARARGIVVPPVTLEEIEEKCPHCGARFVGERGTAAMSPGSSDF